MDRRGTRFVVGGRPLYFTGFNAGQLPQLIYSNRTGAAEALLARAAELGFQASMFVLVLPGKHVCLGALYM